MCNKETSIKPYFERSSIRVSKLIYDDFGKRWIYAVHTNLMGALILKYKGYTNFETALIRNKYPKMFMPLWKKEITRVK